VPLIMAGPGVPEGQRRSQLVSNADLAPTILDAAGGSAGVPEDGRSLFPVLRDPGLQWGRDLLIEGRSLELRFNAVRTPRYIYARYGNGTREMYDLYRDPDELQNLSRNKRYKALRLEMSKRLSKLHRCRGSSCYAAPHLAMRQRPSAGCVPGSLSVSMYGRDRKYVRRVDFYAGKRRVAFVRPIGSARAGRALTRTIRTRHVRAGKRFRVRAKVTFDDGRLFTLDRTRRSCAG
jgi:hypothetical protein